MLYHIACVSWSLDCVCSPRSTLQTRHANVSTFEHRGIYISNSASLILQLLSIDYHPASTASTATPGLNRRDINSIISNLNLIDQAATPINSQVGGGLVLDLVVQFSYMCLPYDRCPKLPKNNNTVTLAT